MLCFELGFGHRVLRVVLRIGFVLCPVICDAAHDLLRIVATRKGTFGICPICFGLAPVAWRKFPGRLLRIAKVPRRLGRIFVNAKILEVIDHVDFVVDAHDERLVIFSVGESRQTKQTRDIGGGWVAAILRSQCTQQAFRQVRVESFNAPNDLMLSRRSVENEVGRWHVAGGADCLKRSACFLTEV